MFSEIHTAAPFTTPRHGNNLNGMAKDVTHIYSGILLSYRKNEIILFVATEMNLEIIIPSKKVRKRKTNTI